MEGQEGGEGGISIEEEEGEDNDNVIITTPTMPEGKGKEKQRIEDKEGEEGDASYVNHPNYVGHHDDEGHQVSQDFPIEWERHHITEFAMAQRDYFCFGLFDYLPPLTRWLDRGLGTLHILMSTICCSFCHRRRRERTTDDRIHLPFIAPAFLSAIHWGLRMGFACLLASIWCLWSPTADFLGCKLTYTLPLSLQV